MCVKQCNAFSYARLVSKYEETDTIYNIYNQINIDNVTNTKHYLRFLYSFTLTKPIPIIQPYLYKAMQLILR